MNELEYYIDCHTTDPSDLLKETERNTYQKFLMPRMLSGKVQGKFLEFISRMVQPKRILEIGTFTGYSTICLAKGLSNDGEIHTIEINDELEDFLTNVFSKSGHTKQIKYYFGDAKSIIPTLNEVYDLVFIDGDKRDYPDYYKLIMEKLKPEGYLIADNVLWGGKVICQDSDEYTEGVKTFNQMVQDDSRVENVIVEMRDGLMLVRKKEN